MALSVRFHRWVKCATCVWMCCMRLDVLHVLRCVVCAWMCCMCCMCLGEVPVLRFAICAWKCCMCLDVLHVQRCVVCAWMCYMCFDMLHVLICVVCANVPGCVVGAWMCCMCLDAVLQSGYRQKPFHSAAAQGHINSYYLMLIFFLILNPSITQCFAYC